MKKETGPHEKQVADMSPELVAKIHRTFLKLAYDEAVSKKAVLHHLKQLKAQMGKKAKYSREHWQDEKSAITIEMCMKIIDKKIKKIDNL